MDGLRSASYGAAGAGPSSAGLSDAALHFEHPNPRGNGMNLSSLGSAVDDGDDLDADGEFDGEGRAGRPSGNGKKAIKGMIRRASLSLHDFIQRRASFASNRTASGIDDLTSPSTHFLPNRLLRSSHTHSQSQSQSQSQSHFQFQSHAQGKLPVRQPSNAENRPTTSHNFSSWRRVRQAASFRHSRIFDSDTVPSAAHLGPSVASGSASTHDYIVSSAMGYDGLDNMHFGNYDVHNCRPGPSLSSSAPLPGVLSSMSGPLGMGPRPPVIPPNTGSAARAAAAAALQADIHRVLQPKWLQQDEDGNDRESGIGIAIMSPGSESADEANASDLCHGVEGLLEAVPQLDITRVDFVANLPIELAIMILSELDAAGLAAASRVSRAWSQAVNNQHIWRESFLREKTSTYATSGPVQPGAGLGVPPVKPTCDWRQIYRVKQELDRRWQQGKTRPVYLNGHSDSIYCLQFDEYVCLLPLFPFCLLLTHTTEKRSSQARATRLFVSGT